jgi:hypothetical protein
LPLDIAENRCILLEWNLKLKPKGKFEMRNLISKINHQSLALFILAGFIVLVGIATGFEHKTLHLICVSACVIDGVLIQWYKGRV